MATKKAKTTAKSSKKKTAKGETPQKPRHSEAYEAALEDYRAAVERLHKRDYQDALELFDKIEALSATEPELAERARTYAVICKARMAPPAEEPGSPRERYYRAVVLANDGRLDEAAGLLDLALKDEPTNATFYYARASVRALQGKTEQVVADLRQAILIDPRVRYQAVNDPDFEKVRDDAAFIDVIEPTPAGA